MYCKSKLQTVLPALILFTGLIASTEGANILFFIGFGGPSHRIAAEPLAHALSEKGHNVTFLTNVMPKDGNPKVSYYVPEKLTIFDNMKASTNLYEARASGRSFLSRFSTLMLKIPGFGIAVCQQLYEDSEFLEWIKTTKFDMVIVDALLNECGYSIAHVQNAKVIVFSASTVLPWMIDGMGIPDESSSIPDNMFFFPSEMNFFQRLVTGVMPVVWRLLRDYHYFPKLTSIVRKGLNQPEFPSINELVKNTSLIFVNTHAAQEFPRSLPPNVVPVGGISWAEKRKPLPKKMEDFINKGKEGFIYISFGSFVDFTLFPVSTQQTFLNALRKFPNIQFIWKLSKVPEDLPENILIEKWMPQQNLLLHPKIRAFITHSGLGGVNEAIYGSVPLICFPVFAEQDYNAQLVEDKKFGIKMEITTLTEDDMENAITKILTDDSYRKNMKKINELFVDRPMKPVETALWWTEYVLRQDNTDSLRPLNVHQSCFGSFIDVSTFSPLTQTIFINALRKFSNIQFIWKLNDPPANLPQNVLVEKWMPQQDLLLHPKIIAFIGHSGLGGINEAIYSSVPLICFPIFADQDYNAHLVERKGFGIKLEITTLTQDEMNDAINQILTDNTYRKNIKRVNELFRDRPMNPVETAQWWTEYVLRHHNTDSLRPLSVHQSWWVKRQIDVWIFILIVLISLPVVSFCVFCKIVKQCFKSRGSAIKTKSKKSKQKLN